MHVYVYLYNLYVHNFMQMDAKYVMYLEWNTYLKGMELIL